MTAKSSQQDKSGGVFTDFVMYIASFCRMQKELMVSFLQQKFQAQCLTVESGREIPLLNNEGHQPPRIVLVDCLGKDPESILVELESFDKILASQDFVLLFNVSPGLRIEEEAVMRGVRGFFYTDDSLDQFKKGIRAVLGGELWLSREIMTRFILEDRRPHRPFKTNASVLTRREIEILIMAASGATNTGIANELYISPHTVKSHLYNIYKKIKVTNRLEAAHWAAKNL